MPTTNKREPKTRPDNTHAMMMRQIKQIPNDLPDGVYPGYVSSEYMDYFSDLLQRHGFKTKRDEQVARGKKGETEIVVYVTGQGVRAAFGNEHANSLYYEERFVAGNARSFDKYNTCPLVFQLPLTLRREAELMEYLRLLAADESEEAYEYPREIDL